MVTFNHPLTSSQLQDADRCPRHGIELRPREYKNPDGGQECRECERELARRMEDDG